MSENIIGGLISGVLATFLIFIFNSIWKKQIIPWFEERVYKDVAIEGNWFSFYPNSEDKRQEAIYLERHGHAVTGTIICVHGHDTGEKYVIAGSFRNMILPMTYESTDSTKTDRGTITLKSVHNGERFIGKIALYQTYEDSIETGTVIWFRSKAALDSYALAIEKKRERINELRQKARNIDKELKTVEEVSEKPPIDSQPAEINQSNESAG